MGIDQEKVEGQGVASRIPAELSALIKEVLYEGFGMPVAQPGSRREVEARECRSVPHIVARRLETVRGRALVIDRRLHETLVLPDVERISGGAIELDLGRSRQLRTRVGIDEVGRTGRLRYSQRRRLAENTSRLHAQQSRSRRGQSQMLIDGQLQLRFNTLHLAVAGIDDGRDAVLALNRGLPVIPSLVENGTIGAQPVIEPVGLPPQLEISERIRVERARGRQAGVGARAKTGGPR